MIGQIYDSRAVLAALAVLAAQSMFPTPAAAKDVGVTTAQVETLGVTIGEARTTDSQPITVLPATVIAAPNARVVVPVPFAGTVISTAVVAGQSVKAGDVLVTIASADYLAMYNRLAETRAELVKARALALRQKSLADQSIAPRNDALAAAEEAARLETVEKDVLAGLERRSIRRVDSDTYALLAPADGQVMDIETAGHKVEATGSAAMVQTSEDLWLEIQVPASLVQKVRPGFRVSIGNGVTGTVVSIVHALDRLTRSAAMLASLPRESGLVPGQLVTVTILGPVSGSAVSVPATAVAYVEGKPRIFLRTGDGFKMVLVDILGKSAEEAVVAGGVQAGDKVATSQLPQLENLAITE